MKLRVPIPKELSHLKLDVRGYPIPYFVPIFNGKPEFRFASPVKVMECAERHLCGICGKKLHKEAMYFIGGPMSFKNGVSTDAPMHRVCAEFSMAVCPYIFFEKTDRRADEEKGLVSYSHLDDKPPLLVLMKTKKYRSIKEPISNNHLFKFTAVKHWVYRYINGELSATAAQLGFVKGE